MFTSITPARSSTRGQDSKRASAADVIIRINQDGSYSKLCGNGEYVPASTKRFSETAHRESFLGFKRQLINTKFLFDFEEIIVNAKSLYTIKIYLLTEILTEFDVRQASF